MKKRLNPLRPQESQKRRQSAVKNLAVLLGFWAASTLVHAAKLAIVIDDVGYRPKEDAAIYDMPKAISVAIIPVAPHAAQRNKQAFEQGRDVLIHLPMQPLSRQKIEDGGLTLGMSRTQVAERLARANAVVSHAIGLNNHMGSAATADQPLMTHLMSELKRRRLFFLDSKTNGRSVAAATAKAQGVNALERHIFLDDSDAYADVQRQFHAAIQYARKQGTAIVIGHPRKNTVAVLQQGLAQLPKDIQLVSIGSLWRNEKLNPPLPFKLIFTDMPAPTSVAPFDYIPVLRGIPK